MGSLQTPSLFRKCLWKHIRIFHICELFVSPAPLGLIPVEMEGWGKEPLLFMSSNFSPEIQQKDGGEKFVFLVEQAHGRGDLTGPGCRLTACTVYTVDVHLGQAEADTSKCHSLQRLRV